MALGAHTLTQVGERLDTLIVGCKDLTVYLDAEAEALVRMDLPRMHALSEKREEALEAIVAAEASLRDSLDDIAFELSVPPEDVLKDGPLAAAFAPRREALLSARERLHEANTRVRVRANHGLAFFRASLGPADGYGALGQSRDLGPSSIKFYRVM